MLGFVAPGPAAPQGAPPAVPPETACAHCGLPVGPRPVGPVGGGPAAAGALEGAAGDAARVFCCTGCAVVADALAAAGLGETYYRLRGLPSSRPASRALAPDPLHVSELDTAAFLDEHTQDAGNGLRRTELFVDGVHCAACVWLVERLPAEVPGVAEARLDLPRARLALAFDPEQVRLSAVAAWLARFGYAARPARTEALGQRTEAERRLLIRTGIAWALAGNVMLVAFALYSGLDAGADARLNTAARWVSLLLATPSVVYGGAPFFARAWASVRAAGRAGTLRHLHMDTPIALGVAVGFAHSAWATVSGRGEIWFDSLAVLIAALLTARYLQLRSRRLAGDASERLLALVPTVARRLGASGAAEAVPVESLRRGDLVEVPPGEVIPVDGAVAEGESRLSNAVLTGESRPVPVGPGDRVEAGATNLSAALRVRVEAAGAQARVGRLLAWVREAGGARPRIVLLADRLGGVFVVAVLAAAIVTAGLWLWLDPAHAAEHVAALLVITCPCALGMATPLSMAVAAGRAAQRGLFVKSDEAMQRLTEIDTLVLDKTGTLTEGRMAVARVLTDEAGPEADPEAVLALAAALEADAAHPIAEALVRAAGPGARAEAVEAEAGAGLAGRVDGRAVRVGRPDWVAAHEGPLAPALAAAVRAAAADGLTPVAIAVDGRPCAIVAVGDRLREDAAATVGAMQRRGLEVHLLSGDHPDAVAVAARTLGLPAERVRGGVGPEDKRAYVEALRARGRVVLMAGDGVNDAAALLAADVGVAVGGGTTASLVAADVFLTRAGLAPLGELARGAGQAMRTVRRALGLSLVYNAAAATAAIAGLVTPLVAAVAMPISSLAVVALALAQPSFRAARSRAAAPRPLR
ncbi:MAG: heavy metal translocating P-type ATPase [Rubricoccaceae bacterium]